MEIVDKLKVELDNIYATEHAFHAVIAMHANPDPDCIGAACGMGKIIKHWYPESKVTLVYKGEVDHPQNNTMINVLNLKLTHVDEIDFNFTEDNYLDYADAYICVDVVPNRSAIPEANYLFVVDHHKADAKDVKLKDIRQVGSASTLVWEYIDYLKINLEQNNEEDSAIATAMLVGIQTDTGNLTTENVTDNDFQAHRGLIESISRRNLGKINSYPIPPYHFELRKRLDREDHVLIENGIFVGGIGYISPAKRDVLPSIAEERARMEGVDTSFILAIVGDNLEVSVRSTGFSIDVDKVCKKIFGKDNAGGKMGAGAAKIPMGEFSVMNENEEAQQIAWDFARQLWFNRILREMSDYR